MQELDKSAFDVELPVLAASVPSSLTAKFMHDYAKGSLTVFIRLKRTDALNRT